MWLYLFIPAQIVQIAQPVLFKWAGQLGQSQRNADSIVSWVQLFGMS